MKKRFTMITIFDKESLDKIGTVLYNTTYVRCHI